MSKLTKKVTSVGLSITTAVWLSGVTAVVPVAFAQGADLQAQINDLLAKIAALQGQLKAAEGGVAITAPAYNFTRDLTVGSKGDDVKALQQWLNANGYQVAASGPGSAGNETSYFGPATKAAVAKYQAAKGISPAVGYFGPKTRAAVVATAPAAVAAAPAAPAAAAPAAVTAPASGLAASLASDSPTGSAIAGAGQIDSAKFVLTAGSAADVTVTGLTFKKVGVVSDTLISNLYVADAAGVILGQFSSLNKGEAIFSGLDIKVGAGKSATVTLRTDLSGSAAAGNTLAWQLTGVKTTGNVEVTGLPVSGNTLSVTTVSNPSIATAGFTFNSVGSTVDAGTNGVLVASVTANVANSTVDLKNIKFTIVGSATTGDLRNVMFKVNGTQYGGTLTSVASNGTATFDLSSKPVRLSTGNSTIELYADIAGSPNRTAQFTILRPYDIHVVDTNYNTGISPTLTTTNATTINISQGQITVRRASDTPTGSIPNGVSNVTLGKFTVYASGEPVKIRFIDVVITRSGGDAWTAIANVTEDVENIKLLDDAGGQVGSTISTVVGGDGNNQCTLASTTITCHLGTSSSQINYIIPANTTRTLSVVADVKSTNDSTSLQASLPTMTGNNLEGQISFQTANSGSATGATLTVTTAPLSVGLNTAFASPTYVGGASDKKIASFVVTAAAAEGGKITSLSIDKDSGTDNLDIQNVKVMVGATQFGSTRPTVADGGVTMSFSGASPITVAAGGSVTVDVYADILTSTVSTGNPTYANVIDLTAWTALGATSNASITFPGVVDGQSVVISSGPTLTLSAPATPAAKQVVMGSTDNSLLKILLSANNVEDVKITDITFTDTITNGSTGIASFNSLKLYDGATVVAGPLNLTMPGATTATVAFSLTKEVTVEKNKSKTLELKGDVATFSSGGATSNSGHTFSIASTGDVTAIGKDSNTSATISGTPGGNAQTVYRTKLSLSSSLLGSQTGRVRAAQDELATVNWKADAAANATLGTVSIKFNGTAVSSGSTAFTVDLLKSDKTALGSATQQTCTPGAGNSCSVTFSPQFTITAGETQASIIRVNSASFFDNANSSEALSVFINAAGDVLVSDGTTAGITLEASAVPFTIVNVSYN